MSAINICYDWETFTNFIQKNNGIKIGEVVFFSFSAAFSHSFPIWQSSGLKSTVFDVNVLQSDARKARNETMKVKEIPFSNEEIHFIRGLFQIGARNLKCYRWLVASLEIVRFLLCVHSTQSNAQTKQNGF